MHYDKTQHRAIIHVLPNSFCVSPHYTHIQEQRKNSCERSCRFEKEEKELKHGDDPLYIYKVGPGSENHQIYFQQIVHFLPEIEANLFIISVHTLRLWSGAGDKGRIKNLSWNLFNWSRFHFYHLSFIFLIGVTLCPGLMTNAIYKCRPPLTILTLCSF